MATWRSMQGVGVSGGWLLLWNFSWQTSSVVEQNAVARQYTQTLAPFIQGVERFSAVPSALKLL